MRRVLTVLQAWRSWSLFEEEFVDGLEVTFLRPGFKSSPTLAVSSAVVGPEADDVVRLRRECSRAGLIPAGHDMNDKLEGGHFRPCFP